MKDRVIVSSDWHLDDNPDHEYRWRVFETFRMWARNPEVQSLWMLGDLTHAKDRHRGAFVRRVTSEVVQTRDVCRENDVSLHFLKGNHDYTDPGNPFFGFIGELEGVVYHSEPATIVFTSSRGDRSVFFAPHGYNWEDAQNRDVWARCDIALAHHTFRGAITSSGVTMGSGDDPRVNVAPSEGCPPILSGDIHVPQSLNRVTYVGSPHPVAFGDHFDPRLLSVDLSRIRVTSIPNYGVQRLTVAFERAHDGSIVQMTKGVTIEDADHVKVRFHGTRSELGRWAEIQSDLRELIEGELRARIFHMEFICTDDDVVAATLPDLDGYGSETAETVFDQFCEAFDIPDEYRPHGRAFLGITRGDEAEALGD